MIGVSKSKIRSTKYEIRNKFKYLKRQNPKRKLSFWIFNLEFRYYFVFRASNFGFALHIDAFLDSNKIRAESLSALCLSD